MAYNSAPCTMMNLQRHLPGSTIEWTEKGHPMLRSTQHTRMICRKRDGRWNYRVFVASVPHDTVDFWECKRLMESK